jgi:hypothetical protein
VSIALPLRTAAAGKQSQWQMDCAKATATRGHIKKADAFERLLHGKLFGRAKHGAARQSRFLIRA